MTRPRLGWVDGIAVVAAVAVLVFAVVTVIRWSGPDVMLRVHHEAGDVTRERMTMDMNMLMEGFGLEQEVGFEVTSTTATRVVAVDDEGNATLETTTEDARIEGLPEPETEQLFQDLGEPVRMVQSPDGGITFSEVSDLGPEFAGLQGMEAGPIFPDHPVGPGDRWESDVVQRLGPLGRMSLHSESRLTRYDEVAGVEVVRIETEMEGPMNMRFGAEDLGPGPPAGGTDEPFTDEAVDFQGDLAGEVTQWIDPVTGESLRTEAFMTINMSMGTGVGFGLSLFDMRMDMEIETELIT